MMQFPRIIQGGMGVGVSNWRLAQAVSKLGQLGVVSGTALDQLFVRRLAEGDEGGYMKRGLDAFPFPEMARRIWQEYFVPGGKAADAPYPAVPMHQKNSPRKLVELCMVSNFVEVFLAKDGHKNPVGINFLEKVQMPHLASIYGAMLAGVGYVLMGAGIPLHIPGVLDAFAAHHMGEYKLQVTGAAVGQDTMMHLDATEFVEGPLPLLRRPKFIAIVSSNTLATTMLRRASGRVDGFVIETPTAGGHNAPPRGKLQLNASGEPVYGERDQVNLSEMRSLGVPFWLAGGYGNADKLREVAQLEGTASAFPIYQERKRVCDLGYLREPYATSDSSIGYRCAAEPVANYVAKGGKIEDTVGRKCLCNALMANVGHAQVRKDGSTELPLVTTGDDLNTIAQFVAPGELSYSATDVVASLLSALPMEPAHHAEPYLLATA
jgi:nitronate monooxygenase